MLQLDGDGKAGPAAVTIAQMAHLIFSQQKPLRTLDKNPGKTLYDLQIWEWWVLCGSESNVMFCLLVSTRCPHLISLVLQGLCRRLKPGEEEKPPQHHTPKAPLPHPQTPPTRSPKLPVMEWMPRPGTNPRETPLLLPV